MRAPWILVGLLLLVAFSAAPLASSSPTECTRQCWPKDPDVNGNVTRRTPPIVEVLYAHCDNGSDDCNLSVRLPADDTVAAGPTLALPGEQPDLEARFQSGELEGFPGTTGLARSVRVAGSSVVGYVYASSRSPPSDALGALPTVYAESQIETGRNPGTGTILAQGRSEPLQVQPGAVEPLEFRIPMTLENATWPGLDDGVREVVWRVWFYELEAARPAGHRAAWAVRDGPAFPTRLLVNVTNPLEITSLSVREHEGAHFVRASALSPFGPFNIDDANVRLEIDGPAPLARDAVSLVILHRPYSHGDPNLPLNVTWRVNLTKSHAAAGAYVARAIVPNLQGTYEAVGEAEFTYRPPEGNAAPGPLLGAAGGAFLAAFVRRRRG